MASEKQRAYNARYRAENRDKIRAQQRRWDRANARRKSLYKHGIALARYKEMKVEQGGRCAICRTDQFGGRGKQLVVDHDHESGLIRGLLCDACNVGLGRFKDNADSLHAAILYLARYRTALAA